MEHIVQFAIGIDDDVITKRITENAEKIIIQQIRQQVEKCIFETDYYGKPKNRINYAAENIFVNWLESNKDLIIKRATEALVFNMMKTKAVKTAINNVLEGDKE